MELGRNQRGPPRKAKYTLMTDSEQVPWGKGEKYPNKGSEIVPEIVDLQGVVVLFMHNCMPFAEWAGELLYVARLRKLIPEPKRKQVLKGR